MYSHGQDNHCLGSVWGHPGKHRLGLSSEEHQDDSTMSSFDSLKHHAQMQPEAPLGIQSDAQLGEASDYCISSQMDESLYNVREKRSIPSHQDSDPKKRQRCGPATPRERPLQSSQITTVDSVNQEQHYSCIHPMNHFSSSSEDFRSHEFQFKTTTTGLFTPTSTLQHEYATQCIDPGVLSQSSSHGILGSPPPTMHELADMLDLDNFVLDFVQNDSGGERHESPHFGSDDEYAVHPEDENDMLQLLHSTEMCIETHMPPSSVLNRWDRDSRSADVYDETLQYSPLQPPEDINDEIDQDHKAVIEDDFLDEDVDWDTVYAISASIPKGATLAGSRNRDELCDGPGSIVRADEQQLPDHRVGDELQPLAPFVRSHFPGKVHDRSILRGISSEVVLRTCFCVGELIDQAAHCYNHHQEVVFELYAKVAYSKREGIARKQYFQLVDLFKEQEPYPLGTLSGLRPGDLKDRQGQPFLETNLHKMCRCMCRAKRDSNTTTGWVLDILDIRETDWEQVRYAKMILGENNCEEVDQ